MALRVLLAVLTLAAVAGSASARVLISKAYGGQLEDRHAVKARSARRPDVLDTLDAFLGGRPAGLGGDGAAEADTAATEAAKGGVAAKEYQVKAEAAARAAARAAEAAAGTAEAAAEAAVKLRRFVFSTGSIVTDKAVAAAEAQKQAAIAQAAAEEAESRAAAAADVTMAAELEGWAEVAATTGRYTDAAIAAAQAAASAEWTAAKAAEDATAVALAAAKEAFATISAGAEDAGAVRDGPKPPTTDSDADGDYSEGALELQLQAELLGESYGY